ncbi:hypothetical protein [Saccharopolyspora sp. NPDC002376]
MIEGVADAVGEFGQVTRTLAECMLDQQFSDLTSTVACDHQRQEKQEGDLPEAKT